MVKHKEITAFLEALAPRELQEDYDNSGWQCGKPETETKGVLICLDITEKVLDEALKTGANLIISHHPVIFKSLKKLTGSNYVERIIEKAIKNDLALYSIHTNLDAVKNGVNAKISELLSLINTRILREKTTILNKLSVFCPIDHADAVRTALWEAGAGNIGNYSNCSFTTFGDGTFKAGDGANPFVGKIGEIQHEKEVKIEVIFPAFSANEIIAAMKKAHPYEEVAYDLFQLQNKYQEAGSGMVGELKSEMSATDFLAMVKEKMQTKMIRHTAFLNGKIKKVAVCGGSGRFLLEDAIRSGADVLVTSDFKYHDFFDADGKILVLDIGHFESEQFTMNLLSDWLSKKYTTFAVRITEINTNPVNYH